MMRIKNRLGKPSSEELIEELQECIANIKAERDEAIKNLADYNKDHEIQKIQTQFDNYKKRYKLGFSPSEEQWKKIEAWENTHADMFHKESERMQKQHYKMRFNPNAAYYEYQFENTAVGTLGSVVCQTCRKKAFERSLGQRNIYDKLMKSMDAMYFIGEV